MHQLLGQRGGRLGSQTWTPQCRERKGDERTFRFAFKARGVWCGVTFVTVTITFASASGIEHV
jgi:hypothetical protein